MTKRSRSAGQPHVVELAAGNYYWCACGRSRRPPYCDGSHRGTTTSPVLVEQRAPGQITLCGCHASPSKPYCDCTPATPSSPNDDEL